MQHLFIAGPESELGKRAALPAFVSYGRPRPAAAASWRKYIFRKSDCDTPTARRRSWSAKKEGGGVKGLDSVGITEPLLHAKWFQMKNKGKEERGRERERERAFRLTEQRAKGVQNVEGGQDAFCVHAQRQTERQTPVRPSVHVPMRRSLVPPPLPLPLPPHGHLLLPPPLPSHVPSTAMQPPPGMDGGKEGGREVILWTRRDLGTANEGDE